MATNTNDYELPTSNAYEELHLDTCEPSCYSNLTYTTRDDVIARSTNTPTTSISGSGPIGQGRRGNKQNTELSRRVASKEETSRPPTIVFSVALILVTVTIVGLVAWNVYLTLAINGTRSDEQVQIYESVTPAASNHAAVSGTFTFAPSTQNTFEDLGPTPLLCPRGWKRYQSSCYLFISERLSFIDAMVFCQIKEGYLVYIDTDSENTFVREECKKRKPARYWIGLNDMEMEEEWVWFGTGIVTNYTDWAEGEPNQGTTANCAFLWDARDDYHWADDPCNKRFSFLCEKGVGQS